MMEVKTLVRKETGLQKGPYLSTAMTILEMDETFHGDKNGHPDTYRLDLPQVSKRYG